MKILKHSLFALALLSLAACNQNTNTDSDSNLDSVGEQITRNDSIVHTDNPPASRDLTSAEGQNVNIEDSELKFTETDTQMKLSLPNSAVFEDGKSEFKSTANATLEETFQVINERGIGKVLITGNTGREGNPEENQKLSTERAMAIAKWLKNKGLKKDVTVSAQGAADRFPMVSYELTDGSPNPQANELNSRTEITFRKSKLATE